MLFTIRHRYDLLASYDRSYFAKEKCRCLASVAIDAAALLVNVSALGGCTDARGDFLVSREKSRKGSRR